MIFLSSQPDDFFFLWQLELQIFNFISVGIKPADIHILLGFDPEKGLQDDFRKLMEVNPGVNIHAYADTRVNKLYPPSLRWHIIAKHIIAFPHLQNEAIFHHDSDIVFKSLPDFSLMTQDDIWYVSDTRSYLNSNYIKSKVNGDVFVEMCRVVGVTTNQVEVNDCNAGGAQYLIKRMNIEFLKKIENDSEQLFELLITINRKQKGYCGTISDNSLIQAWTADMWVIWWAAIYYGIEFRIHPELDFAWADSSIEKLDVCKILHYTGIVDKSNKVFRKADFLHYPPYYQNLDKIDSRLSSGYLKQVISDYIEERKSHRPDVSNLTILITAKIESEEGLDNIYAVTTNILNNIKTNIVLTEIGTFSRVDSLKLSPEVKYQLRDESVMRDVLFDLNNEVKTSFMMYLQPNIILSPDSIIAAVSVLREGNCSVVLPAFERCLRIDRLLTAMFIKIQDVKLFIENENKLMADYDDKLIKIAIFKKVHFPVLYNADVFGMNTPDFVDTITSMGYQISNVDGPVFRLFN